MTSLLKKNVTSFFKKRKLGIDPERNAMIGGILISPGSTNDSSSTN